jgi:UPF0271 protein
MLSGRVEGGRQIDLNCDMGEGMDTDIPIIPYVSSVNIACGYHAGDAMIMRRTVERAFMRQVAIGAHPSYPDREHFGRVDLLGKTIRLQDLADMITDQLDLLQKICREAGTSLHHVKPHGALYNRAAKDAAVSAVICAAIRSFDPSLLLYGLSGSEMKRQADLCGIKFVSEVFADRTYQEDGSLTPRTEAGALIEDPLVAVGQVLTMVKDGKVVATTGKTIDLAAQTVCIHGDGDHAVEFARAVHAGLVQYGIDIRAVL